MNDKLDPAEGSPREPRRPYDKPAIAWEEELDVRKTLAVACGKTAGRGGLCNAAPTS